MRERINFAILGAGNIAADMAKAVNGLSDKVNLYAVASRSLDKAEAFAKKWGVTKAYGSYEEMTLDSEVDLVYIATPHSEHFNNAMLCIKNGKNCLIEKAFCANQKQTGELLAFAKSKGVFVAEAMWSRYQPARGIITDVINSGVLGNISSMEADFSVYIRGVERLEKPELCGGALLDLGIYSVTMPMMYFGTDIKSIKVNSTLNEYGVDLKDEITFVYNDNKMARVKCAFDYDGVSNYCKISGDKGYMVFGPINAPEYYDLFDVDGNLIKHEVIEMLVNGYEYEVLECCEAILNGDLEVKSMTQDETYKMMGRLDSIRCQMGVSYPFESVEDRTHSDIDVWGVNDVFDKFDVWDRTNTTSYLEIFDIETNERKVVGEFDKVIEAPNWSHDGKSLFYNSEGLIYKFDLETYESIRIDSGDLKTMNNDHVLSSDDSEISVSDETLDGKSRIYRIDLNGGEPFLVTKDAPSYLHGQTPDKQKYCYCAERNGEYDIYVINRDGTGETRLTTAPGLNDGSEYDSEGEYIYFNSVRTGLMQAWRMKADGTNQTQLTFDNDFNTWFPHISPDREKIVMISYYKGDLWPGDHVPNLYVELRLMNSDMSDLRTVVKLYGGQGTINVNSWSPDSKKFAFVSYKKNA